MGQNVPKSEESRTTAKIGSDSGDSYKTVQRLIRLTHLVPELQEYVDKGKMKMLPAYELSFLDEDAQRDIVDNIDETETFPSHAQARRMRKAFEEGKGYFKEDSFLTPLARLNGRTVISAALRIYEIPRKQKEVGYRPGGGGCGKEHLQNVS